MWSKIVVARNACNCHQFNYYANVIDEAWDDELFRTDNYHTKFDRCVEWYEGICCQLYYQCYVMPLCSSRWIFDLKQLTQSQLTKLVYASIPLQQALNGQIHLATSFYNM